MAKEEPKVASMDPADMLEGGLKDDFRGKIIEADYCRWDYNGNRDEASLALRLKIQPEDEDEPFTQHWSAGSLDTFVPSKDGKTEVKEDPENEEDGTVKYGTYAGPYALRIGRRPQLNGNTNYAHLVRTIIDSGEASKGKFFTRENLSPSVQCLVGLDAFWNRVPQVKRKGLQEDSAVEGDRKKRADVLVVTEVFGYDPEGTTSKEKVKGKSKAVKSKVEDAEEDQDESSLDDDLAALVIQAIADADGELKKAKLVGAVVKLAGKDPRKRDFLKRVTEDEFLNSGDWEYDEDDGTLTL